MKSQGVRVDVDAFYFGGEFSHSMTKCESYFMAAAVLLITPYMKLLNIFVHI